MAGKKQRKDTEPEKEAPRKADAEGERRDIDAFPEQRNAGEFGTHGGPKQHEASDADDTSQAPRE